MNIELGKTYEDSITGFIGVATCHAVYLNGFNQVMLTPRVDDKGKARAEQWIDEDQLSDLSTPRPVTNPIGAGTRPDLNIGEQYVGAILSADGTKRHHIILLPGEKENINWPDAKAWAESIGGELPDRVESALLFATLKSEFKPEAYWLREQHVSYSGDAWYQHLKYGNQHYYDTDLKLRARAVRRISI